MASNALLELSKVVRFYSDVSDRCPLAAKACVCGFPASLCVPARSSLSSPLPQPVLEVLFERARSMYLYSRYGTHMTEIDPDCDELCKLSKRTGLLIPPTSRPVPVEEGAPHLMDFAHKELVRVYDESSANVPPPNDPILMPGQLHRPSGGGGGGGGANANMNMNANANGSGGGGGGGAARNGACSPRGGSAGFGVSAERSGCQTDAYGSGGATTLTPQHFKWLSAESSEYTWMTWF